MWRDTATKVDRRRTLVRRMALLLAMLVVLAAYLYGFSQSPVVLYAEALSAVEWDYVDQEAIDPKKQTYGAIEGMLDSLRDEGFDPKKQTYGAIEGMLDSLGDKGHTRFLTPEEAEESREVISSKYVGIGIRVEDKDDQVVVSSPIDGSPAKEAGIESGDVLVTVDGEDIKGEDFKRIAEKIRGPEGSRVDLKVLRGEEEHEFSVERAELEVPAASWRLIPGTDVAHLRLASFSEDSAAKLDEAITEAQGAGAKRFVLDLRDNSGGLVEQAEKVAARFLPAGSGIYIRKDAEGEEEATSVPDGNEPLDAPLTVLVNKGSASSSEILAGALRDNGRAKVVGEKTFGTGTVLAQHTLSDGSVILLGVAEWLTPNGDFIRESGIVPDVEAKLEEGQKPRAPDDTGGLSREEIFAEDAQLKRAFEVLQEE